MNIYVPDWAVADFWKESDMNYGFWAFIDRPYCHKGEDIYFYVAKQLVARAIVCDIVSPDIPIEGLRGFWHRWKVLWHAEDFIDLRGKS